MPTEDDDVRDLFARANPDSGPRLMVSAADVVAKGRRVHRRRRQLAAVGSTVAVIALAAALTTTLARPQTTPAGPGGSTQVPITHTGPKPKPLPTADHTPVNTPDYTPGKAVPPPTATTLTTIPTMTTTASPGRPTP
ncbi:MAG TPA: hypothetical protein VHZ97_17600 [Pseudonocardiaceae bacterium]|jgi:hypothetical protein|nr:hypothetical protein [Pseudonocardiaceae bacterium]